MKVVAIALIVLSICWCVRIYLKNLEKQLEYLTDWIKIFRAWREWIARFSISVDELVERTCTETLTAELTTAKKMNNLMLKDVLYDTENRKDIPIEDKQVVVEVLKNIGDSMVESELEALAYAISKLDNLIVEREKRIKEHRKLAYKLTPLLCGALAIILW